MPPKRSQPPATTPPPTNPAVTINDQGYQSPPPAHHIHNLPAMPMDASTSPPSKKINLQQSEAAVDLLGPSPTDNGNAGAMVPSPTATEMPMDASTSPPSKQINLQQSEAAVDLLGPSPTSNGNAGAMVPSPTANGGARAAFNTAQQQRTITCNLSLLSPSKAMSTRFFNTHKCCCRCSATENTSDRHHYCDVHPTTRATCTPLHVGGG